MDKLPDQVLYGIFSFLSTPQDLCRCSCVCKKWKNIVDTYGELWEQLLEQSTPLEFRNDPQLRVLSTPKAKLVAYERAWSEHDHSGNIYVMKNKLTLHRNPVAQSSDAIRGKVGFTRGEHYWTVVWHGPRFGSSAVVGVATKDCKLHGEGYFSLLGSNEESWGWDVSESVTRYGGDVICKYPKNADMKVGL